MRMNTLTSISTNRGEIGNLGRSALTHGIVCSLFSIDATRSSIFQPLVLSGSLAWRHFKAGLFRIPRDFDQSRVQFVSESHLLVRSLLRLVDTQRLDLSAEKGPP